MNLDKFVALEKVEMTFHTKSGTFTALKDVNLDIKQGEFVSIIGHSGCGKSTVLNIIAGLYEASSGVALCANKEIAGPGPDRAVVFQNHSLLPWLTVYENVMLAVDAVFANRKTATEKDEWVKYNLQLVHMDHAMHKRPNEISGGMKQRVGIARALAMQPKVLLMDEPFGALDALTRAHLQDELMKICASINTTVVMVTHDVDEAVLLSDKIVMMTNGPAATVGEILTVNLPRPRDRLTSTKDEVYLRCRQAVLSFLYEKHRKDDH